MNLSISNIAWSQIYDDDMYNFLSKHKINGLEIAPTRIFPNEPYEDLEKAILFSKMLKNSYGLSVSSMQSIWYGVTESIFGSDDSRQFLVAHTEKAVDFAVAVGCTNLVFGCPKNRNVHSDMEPDVYLPIVCDFFNRIGSYAAKYGVCISIEPNPPIYNTNFINTTLEAFNICKDINNPGIKVNVDVGTIIHNNETLDILTDNINLINHVHISEPNLIPIEHRLLHKDLIQELLNANYNKFLSIEMGNKNDIELVKKTIMYVKELVL